MSSSSSTTSLSNRTVLYLYLAIGGVVGTFARYGVRAWLYTPALSGFPWSTFAVNLVGSFLLGLAVRAADISAVSPEVRIMITVGFCGAFTTFSTFTFEALALMQEGAWVRASLYAFGSIGFGLVAVALGLSAGTMLARVS